MIFYVQRVRPPLSSLVATSWVKISGDNPPTIVELMLLRAIMVAPDGQMPRATDYKELAT